MRRLIEPFGVRKARLADGPAHQFAEQRETTRGLQHRFGDRLAGLGSFAKASEILGTEPLASRKPSTPATPTPNAPMSRARILGRRRERPGRVRGFSNPLDAVPVASENPRTRSGALETSGSRRQEWRHGQFPGRGRLHAAQSPSRSPAEAVHRALFGFDSFRGRLPLEGRHLLLTVRRAEQPLIVAGRDSHEPALAEDHIGRRDAKSAGATIAPSNATTTTRFA